MIMYFMVIKIKSLKNAKNQKSLKNAKNQKSLKNAFFIKSVHFMDIGHKTLEYICFMCIIFILN